MPATFLSPDALVAWIGGAPMEVDGPLVVVELDRAPGEPDAELNSGIPHVVVGITSDRDRSAWSASCDIVLGPDDPLLDALIARVERSPMAAVALAILLRGSEARGLDDGLVVESASYSALQAGPELARWLAGRPPSARPASQAGDPVRVIRDGARLNISLNRPEVANALDSAMSEALVDAFALAALDTSITEIHLTGQGDAFCSGGDLGEFGTFEDPASAHLLRLRRSAGRAIAAVADRVTAHLHGACVGSGIELPAFAGRVVAASGTRISLPELSMGLIPGAGGTVSLPRRIGRQRTARLAFGGETIDAETALSWGLVDEVVS